MFGLMKYRTVQNGMQTDYTYRQFYCGTCKTLGKSFGQTSRMLLNHDAIFLGELLHHISSEDQEVFEYAKAYESFNCFRLPKQEEIPASLQYAAAANVLLGALSAEDHITDGRRIQRIGWKTVKNALRPALMKANPVLNQAQLPLDQIYGWIAEQQIRENTSKQFQSYEDAACYFAEPTAQITALVFQHGAIAVGKPAFATAFFEFGYHFGQLIYLLDAFDDFEKDEQKHAFNGIQKAFQQASREMTHVSESLPLLQQQLGATKAALLELPISETLQTIGTTRLVGNTQRILGIHQVCCIHQAVDCSSKMTFKKKWQAVNELSLRILAKGRVLKETWWGRMHQKTSQYALASTMMLAPESHIRQLAEQPEVAESYTSLAYLPLLGAAMLGVISLIPFVSAAMPKNPAQGLRKTQDCWSDCFSECCTSCCESCCQACCDAVCEETCGGTAGPS
ncbi:MAG: DUF5685 family protein [Flammeovirgaceae bacterium]